MPRTCFSTAKWDLFRKQPVPQGTAKQQNTVICGPQRALSSCEGGCLVHLLVISGLQFFTALLITHRESGPTLRRESLQGNDISQVYLPTPKYPRSGTSSQLDPQISCLSITYPNPMGLFFLCPTAAQRPCTPKAPGRGRSPRRAPKHKSVSEPLSIQDTQDTILHPIYVCVCVCVYVHVHTQTHTLRVHTYHILF